MKSYLSTLILSGVLVLLLGWYFVYEKRMKPKATEAEEKTKQLIQLDKDQIGELTIVRISGAVSANTSAKESKPAPETIHLKKSGQDWNLALPVQDAADSTAINGMIGTLTSSKQERVVDENPKDLEPYGLKEPSLKIKVKKDANDSGQELLIGKNTPVGYSSYAKLEGRPEVYRVSRTLFTSFDKDATSLRNKSVFNIARTEVTEVEIQIQKTNIVLKRDDKENWWLAREHIPADTNEVNKTLNAILDLKATEFASEDGKNLSQFGLQSPAIKVWLTQKKDKSRSAIWLGQHKGKTYAKREDKNLVTAVDKDVFEKANRPAAQYRSLELASFNRFDVKRIKLERGKEIIELLKEENGWQMPTEPKSQIDGAKVDGFLTSLQDSKIVNYLPQGRPLTEPNLVIRLFEKKDKQESEKVMLKFAKGASKQVIAEKAGLGAPFSLKEEDFKKLNVAKENFFKTEPKEIKKEPEKKS
ncbi:MAG: DUF4340 domain-containing protein [Deltaproteobacteria bacterium]|nr:DUF4340 domain-containing protein [Deltaproteobacteria bacterium]